MHQRGRNATLTSTNSEEFEGHQDGLDAQCEIEADVWFQEPSPFESKDLHPGWYWLKSGGGPHGPFKTEHEAIIDLEENS